MFNDSEVAMGPAAREMTYKIQKWNVVSERLRPILVANARVDWLALKDDEITQKFPILREGILQDVFSQRASSAWQGAQPQRITVSLLLPGSRTAAQWRDFLQSRCQFWPTMTTRHASLAPLCAEALQRERRQMQSKHLWDTIDIRWHELSKKIQVLKPTGLTREQLWHHLFVLKHRQNPFQERKYKGVDFEEVERRWNLAKGNFRGYQGLNCPFSINVEVAIGGFNIDNMAAQKAISDSKALHARRWQTKEGTYRIKEQLFPDVRDGQDVRDGAAASSSDTVHCSQNWYSEYYDHPRLALWIYSIGMLLGGARHVNALRMSHLFTCGSRVSHVSGTHRGLCFLGLVWCCFLLGLVLFWFPPVFCFCKCQRLFD